MFRKLSRSSDLRSFARISLCRGLLAAATADVDVAIAQLENADALLSARGDTFGRGRAALVRGIVLRRNRQKRTARDALNAAVAAFDELGAKTWAARARRERDSIGGRTQAVGLTAAEGRVFGIMVEADAART